MEATAPTDAGNDVASMAATVITADTATKATAETAGAEPAETTARMLPLTTPAETSALGLLRTSRDAIRHIVTMLVHKMAARMPEPPPATAPAEVTPPATDRHQAMASEILAKTKGKRKLFDKPQRRLRYLSGRIAGTHGPAESTRAPAAPQPRAVRTVADAPPPTKLAAIPADIVRVARVRRRTPGTTKTLRQTAAAARVASPQPVAQNPVTTAQESVHRKRLTHFPAVVFCYRVLTARHRHHFFKFRRVLSICHLLGLYPREVIKW